MSEGPLYLESKRHFLHVSVARATETSSETCSVDEQGPPLAVSETCSSTEHV